MVNRLKGFGASFSLTAQSLASILLGELQGLVGHDSDKLIAQTYDGAAALSGIRNGVQALFKAVYPKAHFIHCYAHQLNLIFRKATSANSTERIFFNSLSGIPPFFSKSPQRMAALEQIAGRRIPSSPSTRCNFQSRTVNAVREMREALIACCDNLSGSQIPAHGLRGFEYKVCRKGVT